MGGISLKKLKCSSVTRRFCQACGGQSGVSAGRRHKEAADARGLHRCPGHWLRWYRQSPTRRAHRQRHRAQRRTEKPRHVLQHSRRPLRSPQSRRPPRRHRQGRRSTRASRPAGRKGRGRPAVPPALTRVPPSLRGRVRSGGRTAPRGPPPQRGAAAQKPIPHFRMK